ncbi:hypothetical protein JOE60_001532 [Paenarthrobacter ilicis]|uniref:MFS transporter n=1 Tax=Paenarthrobacter ilicis TaxID=43665 RepID=A0ABX0TRM1_9MICC|nr:hypothetical protein [Paenarthrobacter ilicis]NIJ03317.1 hypothetical protein [Paenarthrobacter ilicis]
MFDKKARLPFPGRRAFLVLSSAWEALGYILMRIVFMALS